MIRLLLSASLTAVCLLAHPAIGQSKESPDSHTILDPRPIVMEWRLSPGVIHLMQAQADAALTNPEITFARRFLALNGVTFEGKSFVAFYPKSSTLIVKNNQMQLNRISDLIQTLSREAGDHKCPNCTPISRQD